MSLKFWFLAFVGLYGCWPVSLMAADANLRKKSARYFELLYCAPNMPTEVLDIIDAMKQLPIVQQEDVVKAANENKEPPCIEDLTEDFNNKFKAWADQKKIDLPKEKIALLIMM